MARATDVGRGLVPRHQCERCGKGFTSRMRLQHHLAAEHAAKTMRDIHTTRDLKHGLTQARVERRRPLRTRGLSDLRTATTSRLHAKPPQKGTDHLNLYLLGKEAQRLEKEMAGLGHRQQRIQAHLAEISKATAKMEEGTQPERSLPCQATEELSLNDGDGRRAPWKKMLVEY